MEFLIFDAAPPTNVRKGGRPWFPTGGKEVSETLAFSGAVDAVHLFDQTAAESKQTARYFRSVIFVT